MLRGDLVPAAEDVFDGHEADLRELVLVFGGDRLIVDAVAELGDRFNSGANGETVRKITAAGVVTTAVGVAGQATAVVLGADPRLLPDSKAVVEEFRKRDCERLEMQMEQGNIRAGMHLSFGAADSQAFDPQAE